jgi:hypothetical protein
VPRARYAVFTDANCLSQCNPDIYAYEYTQCYTDGYGHGYIHRYSEHYTYGYRHCHC